MRIYLDKNIYSYLRKNPDYSDLLTIIKKTLHKHTYLFSPAHIMDLLNDMTDEKYTDLDFIGQFVNNNYLCKGLTQQTNCFIVSPIDAYNDYVQDVSSIMENDFSVTPELIHQLEEFKRTLSTSSEPNFDSTNTPEFFAQYLKSIFAHKDDFNSHRLLHEANDFFNKIKTDGTAYKELRRFLKNSHAQLFPINDNTTDLDDLFEKSIFKKKYMSFIDSQLIVSYLHPNDYIYFQFTSAYSTLNSMGLDDEKNRKANFTSTSNDSLHAFYGGYCDILVTEDVGLQSKGKIVYNIYGIDTTIMNPDDFHRYLLEMEYRDEQFNESLQDFLLSDIATNTIYHDESDNKINVTCKSKIPYLSHFNYINICNDVVSKNVKHICLRNSTKRLSPIIIFNELRSLTNLCNTLFKTDIFDKSIFTDDEINEIKEGHWQGRSWRFNNGYIHLNIDKINHIFYILIIFE